MFPVSKKEEDLTDKNSRLLTAVEFQGLAEMPQEVEWFANIRNPQTRRAYQQDLQGFMSFVGIREAKEFRVVTRAHILAWRKVLEDEELAGSTIRRKLSALSSLFEYLCNSNTVSFNPTTGVTRPKIESYLGSTPALGDYQVRDLLAQPDTTTLKGLRDLAILSVLAYHGIRRAELAGLRVKDVLLLRGVAHLRIHGKGDKLRDIPLHPNTAQAIDGYLSLSGHKEGALFLTLQPARKNKQTGISADGVYQLLKSYASMAKIPLDGIGPHSLRATAATNALEHGSDIAQVQAWLGHANIETTKRYDRRQMRPADSPTFKINY